MNKWLYKEFFTDSRGIIVPIVLDVRDIVDADVRSPDFNTYGEDWILNIKLIVSLPYRERKLFIPTEEEAIKHRDALLSLRAQYVKHNKSLRGFIPSDR